MSKNRILIQPLLFPPTYLKDEPELFFQNINPPNISEEKVSIPAGSTVSLETYFNAFSVGKWKEYTKLDNLSLQIKIQGDVEIKAYHAVGSVDNELLKKGKGKLTEKEFLQKVNSQAYRATREEIPCTISKQEDACSIKFNQLYADGVLYIVIQALSDAVVLGGGYETDIDESSFNPVKLAIGICTFRREVAVTGNINCLLREIINNPVSPLKDKLEIYIADNGQTLDIDTFDSDKVHILPNPNLGGAGGFTRTMIESMFNDKTKEFTHVIFMDDDILLYPAIFVRTFYLLQMLKPEYQKAILGASTFLDNYPTVQQEIGAVYKVSGTYIGRANHKYFDMRNPDAVSSNEVINETNYTGWWFACIPRSVATENNLPMPYFIHYDDVEYGLRNVKNRQLFINGICVWHPSPDNKGPFWITYYNVRNRLITMFSYGLGKKSYIKYLVSITKVFLFHITRYEYKRAALLLRALNDFLKGSASFVETDALRLQQELINNKVTYVSPEDAGVDRKTIVSRHHKNFLIAGLTQLFFNILPAKDKVVAVDGKYFNIPYRAKKLFIYDDKIDKGYVLIRDQKAFFKLLFCYNRTVWKLFWGYSGLLHDWQEAKPTLTSLPFWEKYLGLNKS